MSENDFPASLNQDPSPDDVSDKPTGDAPAESDFSVEDELRLEVAALNDRMLRFAAELENTRRRADREKADAGRYAIGQFARDLLSVADNFDRALRAVPSDGDNPSADSLTSVIAGLQMTEKELLSVFERHGVRRLFPQGEKFDPHLHQAVAQVPSDLPVGHVVDVAQPGFMIGERVLRAAMVTVSTGVAATDPPD